MTHEPTIERLSRTFDALIVLVIAGLCLGMLFSLCGCSRPYWHTDETVLGVEFDWADEQQDRQTADELICFCSAMVGDGRLLTGARVKFVKDVETATRDCARANPEPIAGCWSTLLNDMIVLAPAPQLGETALCHELAHRARYFAKGQGRNAEDQWHCDRALWDQLGVKATGPCPP